MHTESTRPCSRSMFIRSLENLPAQKMTFHTLNPVKYFPQYNDMNMLQLYTPTILHTSPSAVP